MAISVGIPSFHRDEKTGEITSIVIWDMMSLGHRPGKCLDSSNIPATSCPSKPGHRDF